MKKRIIEIIVNDEYVLGSGVVIGAAGSDNSVILRAKFNDTWLGLNVYATFRDSKGENPVAVLLCPTMVQDSDGETVTYDIEVPSGATAIDGKLCVVFSGFVVTGTMTYNAEENKYDQLVYRDAVINTTNAYFRVLPSDFSALDVEDQAEVTALEQVLAEINAFRDELDVQDDKISEVYEAFKNGDFKGDAYILTESDKEEIADISTEALKKEFAAQDEKIDKVYKAYENGELKGDKGDKGDSYDLTEDDKAEIAGKIENEYFGDINSALDAIIAIQEELIGGGDPEPVPSEGLAFTAIDGGYEVSGIGTCEDTDIVIPSSYNNRPVTSIGSYAFMDFESLTSIVIPDSVTNIEHSAFYGCDNLTSVTIGNGVTSIGSDAFYNCSSLMSVTIGNGVRGIGDWAFDSCTSLTSITIPDSVTSIGFDAFKGCTSLTYIYVPWSEGKISGAPWGAPNATIYYNSEV